MNWFEKTGICTLNPVTITSNFGSSSSTSSSHTNRAVAKVADAVVEAKNAPLGTRIR